VLVGNADAYLAGGDIAPLLRHWDGEHVRLLGVPAGALPAEFGGHRFAGFSLLPWRYVVRLAHAPADLVKAVWRPAEAIGQLRVIEYSGHYLDSGTPADYVAANLDAARLAAGPTERRGRHAHADDSYALIAPDATVTGTVVDAVVGPRAEVHGHVERSVIWPDAYVGPDEKVVDAIRYGTVGTIDARRL
jgi:NDP-sugar pyrophosphorylase family protein